MLQVFYGTDVVNVRGKAHEFISTQAEAGYDVQTIDADTYQTGMLDDVAQSASLFGGKSLYFIDTPSTKKDFYEDVTAHLEVFAESENVFVIVEGSLLAPEKKKFATHAVFIEEYKSVTGERFNVFALADALSRKDKKTLWLLFHEAQRAGIVPEEIIGTLWWQLKTLRLAAMTNSADEAGMKDFPYNKAKRALGAFKEGELEALSESLLVVQHESRLGTHDLDLALERWMLNI